MTYDFSMNGEIVSYQHDFNIFKIELNCVTSTRFQFIKITTKSYWYDTI